MHMTGTVPFIFQGQTYVYSRTQVYFRDSPCIFQGQSMNISGTGSNICFRNTAPYTRIFQGRSPAYSGDCPLHISGAAPDILGDTSVPQRQPNYLSGTDHVFFRDRVPCMFQGHGPIYISGTVPCTFQGRSPAYSRDGPLFISGTVPCIFQGQPHVYSGT
jgi:hypothetical protein